MTAQNAVVATQSFEQVADALDGACRWLEQLGIRVKNTRYRAYSATIRRWATATPTERGRASGQEMQDFVVSALEGFDLVDIWRAFVSSESEHLIARLNRLVKGPLSYVDENPDSASNVGRNFGLELLVASKLALAGLPVDLARDEDIRSTFHARPIYIECKRPQSSRTFVRQVNEGLAQLKTRYPGHPGLERGVLAIDLTKIGNPAFKVLRVENEGALPAILTAAVQQIFEQACPTTIQLNDPRTLGLMLRLVVVALMGESYLPVVCQQLEIWVPPRGRALETKVARQLKEAIERASLSIERFATYRNPVHVRIPSRA